MRSALALVAMVLTGAAAAQAQQAPSILFIGNSFTFGSGSAVRYYRANTVTDLNDEGIGGVPALFKSFADQSGLDYDVYLETRGGSNFDFHVDNKLDVIANRPWDKVVAHGYSTLDADKPGDPTAFVAMGVRLAEVLHDRNPAVEIYLTATWSRADKTYPSDGPWHGEPIEAMALDVRAGYDLLAAEAPGVKSVNPVGEAWTRAMQTGVADPNPYDGIDPEKLDLWTYDHYHASTAGYYLEALVIFGNVTGVDPRALGAGECSGMELGLSGSQVGALQQVAYDQLTVKGPMTRAPAGATPPRRASRCAVR
ncbi:MAG: PEP-CTERM sorting domain-containing protein [Gemmatimonadota bacterium]|nr:PEP-CTERM sorting domain-containing protein [Gemmatimonadota bacterium]MDH3424315.1 PEP-CTERM sorting domain-containing protein [Gemmatimonadota bacterium]